MQRMIYQVYVGKPSKLYDHCVQSVADYCKRFDITHHVQRTPQLWIKPDPFTSNRSKEAVDRVGCLPIYEKENAFAYLPHFDQVAIVDADIYIRKTAPNIFDYMPLHYAFGGVVERDMPITPEYTQKIIGYSKMQYGTLNDVNWYWDMCGAEFMNMGLMMMNSSFHDYLDGDTPKQFITRPEFKRFVDGVGPWKWSTDQTLLNYWLRKRQVPTYQLDWTWNALYKGIRDDKLGAANFIHFFLKDKLPNAGENVAQLMRDIGE